MDWRTILASTVIAAALTVTGTLIGIWRRGKIEKELELMRSQIAQAAADRRADIETKHAELKNKFDYELALQKNKFDQDLGEQKNRLERELATQKNELENRASYAAERVAHQLMMDEQWRLRSFDTIKRHLKGFDGDDLRQILVRAGAISFTTRSGKEMWGLLERNQQRLGIDHVDEEPSSRPAGGGGLGRNVVQAPFEP